MNKTSTHFSDRWVPCQFLFRCFTLCIFVWTKNRGEDVCWDGISWWKRHWFGSNNSPSFMTTQLFLDPKQVSWKRAIHQIKTTLGRKWRHTNCSCKMGPETSYNWSFFTPYKWPYKWVTGVISYNPSYICFLGTLCTQLPPDSNGWPHFAAKNKVDIKTYFLSKPGKAQSGLEKNVFYLRVMNHLPKPQISEATWLVEMDDPIWQAHVSNGWINHQPGFFVKS